MYSSLVTEGRKRGHLKPELFTDFWVGRQRLSLFLSFFNEPQVVEQKEPTCLAMKSARSSKLIRDRHLLLPFPLLVSSSLLPSLKYLFFGTEFFTGILFFWWENLEDKKLTIYIINALSMYGIKSYLGITHSRTLSPRPAMSPFGYG